ncbi:MAG: restriction endonuclease subunit S [Pseudomonadota bacterium]|nr:restriction endonuclease subunit S [Pseudomonadota bacterium]
MSPEPFLTQFGHLADAPNGIAKLRELILQLAVKGELVPQDPNDEPASVLLERIRAEKERLVSERMIKKTKSLPPIDPDETPFVVPNGWMWAHLTDVLGLVTDGDHQPPPRSESGKPFLVIGNLNQGRVTFEGCRWVPEAYYRELDWGRKPRIGDILYTVTGSYGIPIPVDCDTEFCVQRHVAIFKAAQSTPSAYLMILLGSRYAFDYATAVATGIAQKTVPLKGLRTMPLPIAPIGEQSRIVAKVDQLMALCDDLEAKQNQRTETHGHLIRAAHQPLTQPHDHAEFQAAWKRIRDNFDRLHTTTDSVKALRQTILQLAVQGRLVPQDPNDEPASVLLEKIRAEKERLVAEGKIKKEKPLSPVGLVELPFDLPESWQRTRFGAVYLDSAAGWSLRAENRPASDGEWGVLKVSAVSWGEFRSFENKALPTSLAPRPQYEVMQGDFLLSRANTADLVARSVVVGTTPSRLMMSDKIIRLHLDSSLVDIRYLNLFNNSSFARAYYAKEAGGTSSSMKNVSRKQIALLPVALPPRPEQSRIVARVEQLTVLCDELETKIEANQGTAQHFAETVVAELAAQGVGGMVAVDHSHPSLADPARHP